MALPTMAPSETAAIFFACSGVEIPNPMAHGISLTDFTSRIKEAMSVLISERIPVTPRELTQYTNPSASAAIIFTLSELVGAGVFVAQDRQLVLDERVIDKGRTGRIVGDGHGLMPLSLRPEDGLADKAHGDVVASRRA